MQVRIMYCIHVTMVSTPDVSFGIFFVASLKFVSSIDSQLVSGIDGNLSGATFSPACCSNLMFADNVKLVYRFSPACL